MVDHQAVSKNSDAGLAAVLPEQIELDAAVLFGVMNNLTIGSALGNMMRKSGDDTAGNSGHRLKGGNPPKLFSVFPDYGCPGFIAYR